MTQHIRSTSNLLVLFLLAACGGSGGGVGAGGGAGDGAPEPTPTASQDGLVKDLNTAPLGTGSNPRAGVSFRNQFILPLSTPETGEELFRSDGTAVGTVLLKDILAGSANSSPRQLTVAGSQLFFLADDDSGVGLWVTDGTPDQTRKIEGLTADPRIDEQISIVGVIRNQVMLRVVARIGGTKLFKSDGGPVAFISDLAPDDGQTLSLGGRVFFTAVSGLHVTDGTTAGTVLVKSGSFVILAASDDAIFLKRGAELWKSNGSTEGTVLVSSRVDPSFPAVFLPNQLIFVAQTTSNGRELFKSDGTEAGTVLIKDIVPGQTGSDPDSFTVLGDRVLFRAAIPGKGHQLWGTDGTSAGTALIKELDPGRPSRISQMIEAEGVVFFNGETLAAGSEPWVTDGSAEGTGLLLNIHPGRGLSGGANSSFPTFLGAQRDQVFVSASDGENGREMWVLTRFTARLVNLVTSEASQSSTPQEFEVVGNRVFFGAKATDVGSELCVSDGTAEGTEIVRDIRSGPPGSDPLELTAIGDKVVFTAAPEIGRRELFVSDGFTAGTQVLEINVGTSAPNPTNLTRLGELVVFSADDGVSGTEPWVTDGTLSGTRLLKDLSSGSSQPGPFMEFSGRLFFAADGDAAVGRELFVTDGTSKGTQLFFESASGPVSGDPVPLTVVGSKMLFTAKRASFGLALLWATDGKAGEAVPIDLGGAIQVQFLGTLRQQAFFVVGASILTGQELWSTDGTQANTKLVTDSFGRVAIGGASARESVAVGDFLYFSASEGPTGEELWRTDGTAEGTTLAREVLAGPAGSSPSRLTQFDADTAFFIAADVEHGRELWVIRSDGSVDLFHDFRDGPADGVDSVPARMMVRLGSTLLLAANDGSGTELHRVQVR